MVEIPSFPFGFRPIFRVLMLILGSVKDLGIQKPLDTCQKRRDKWYVGSIKDPTFRVVDFLQSLKFGISGVVQVTFLQCVFWCFLCMSKTWQFLLTVESQQKSEKLPWSPNVTASNLLRKRPPKTWVFMLCPIMINIRQKSPQNCHM